jgi:hypothetical protein
LANTFTRAAIAIPTSGTPVTLYTATGVKAVVHALFISNTGGAAITVTIEVVVGATPYSLGTNLVVPVGQTLNFEKPINLDDTDVIRITSDTNASTTAYASILEVS